jgi:hypothetical protein
MGTPKVNIPEPTPPPPPPPPPTPTARTAQSVNSVRRDGSRRRTGGLSALSLRRPTVTRNGSSQTGLGGY